MTDPLVILPGFLMDARGFLPQETVSCHWLAEPAFADAVERFLQREGGMIDGYLDELTERSPLRRSDRG